jgi:hypothetical protein
MKKQTTAPDWSFWGNLPEVRIWQAVALSLNTDPALLDMPGGFDPDRCQNLPTGFIERLTVACSNLNPPSMYERYTPPFLRMVGLEDFGVWADNLPHPWDLPPPFPPIPTSETIVDESIESPDEESLSSSKHSKATGEFCDSLAKLISEIDSRARNRKIDFQSESMPGRKVDFQELADKWDAELKHTKRTFSDYIKGICTFRRGARETNFYRNLFPELFTE